MVQVQTAPQPWGRVEAQRNALLGLCGFARSGKDTIYHALGLSWARVALADALKRDLSEVVAIARRKFPAVPEDEFKETMRPLFVDYGRAMRKLDPNYWIERADSVMREYRSSHWNVCVTDVRYANEVAWVLRSGGCVLRVQRPNIGPANAEEERSFAKILADYPSLPTLMNDSTPEVAAARALDLLDRHHEAVDGMGV